MSIAVQATPIIVPARHGAIASGPSRLVLLVVVVAAGAAGLLATGAGDASAAVSGAGPELTHLLRAMAAMKALFAAAAIAATAWRLGVPVSRTLMAGYVLAAASMAAGPGLIWDMAHVRTGAVLLHGGLLASILLLWRDPATASQLAVVIARRRARPGAG